MATILAHDKLVVISTGNSALIWNAESDNIQIIEQPRGLEQSTEAIAVPVPVHKEGSKAPRRGETSSEHEERHMACVAVSPCGQWLALASSRGRKQLGLWRTSDWGMESARPMVRAASCVRFTPSSSAVVLAGKYDRTSSSWSCIMSDGGGVSTCFTDKAGDVYLYSVKEPKKEKEWLLGHIAMLLDVLITPDEKYIITCDRDEKIRVSYFPNAYHIHSYCLSHDMFVTSLSLLPHSLSTLVSTSGDGSLRLWDFESGQQLLCMDVQAILNPDAAPDASPLAVKSCSGMLLDPQTSLLCVCIAGDASCAVFRVTGGGAVAWETSLVQRLQVAGELWSLALGSGGRLLTLSHCQQQAVAAWHWNPQPPAFSPSEQPCVRSLNQYWDSSLKSCFSLESVPAMLYRRKYADDADNKAIPSERPVKILKNK